MPLPDILDEDYVPSQSIDESYARIENLIEQLLVELGSLGYLGDDEPHTISESPMIRLCHEMREELSNRVMLQENLVKDAVVKAVHTVMMADLSEYTDYWDWYDRRGKKFESIYDELQKRIEECEHKRTEVDEEE